MEFLSEYYIPVVLVFCLCIGYIMKQWLPTDNKIIPTALFVVGAICGCIALGFNFEAIVKGGLTGLSATGLHQAFYQFINNGGSEEDIELEEDDDEEEVEG